MQRIYLNKLKQAEKITKASIIKMAVTILIKVLAGYITGMVILFTSALKTFTTIVSLFAGWIGIKASQKTADKHFEYGYYKVETFASFLASTFILYLGLKILMTSIEDIIEPEVYNFGFFGVFTVIIAIASSWSFSMKIEKAAKLANLSSLMTSAHFKKMDTIAYFGILFGAIAAIMNIPLIEPILSSVIALIILFIAARSFKNSLYCLLDYWSDSKLLNRVKKVLKKHSHIVDKIEQVKLRQAGPLIFGEALLKVNAFANMKDVRNTIINIKEDVLKLSPYIQDFTLYTSILCPQKTLVAIPIKANKGEKSPLAKTWKEIKNIMLIEIKNNKTKVKDEIKYRKMSHDELTRELVKHKVNVFIWGEVDSLMYYQLERVNQIQVYPSFSNAKTVADAIKLFTIDT